MPLFFAGALMDLALAPFYLAPVLLFSFPVLYVKLTEAKTGRQAFWSGWWFGFGYYVFGLYWVSNSLLVDLRFAWLIPFAICLIPAAIALFTGTATYLFKRSKTKNPALLAVFWVAAEYVRGYFPFGGFPWNNIGDSGLFSIYFVQVAALGGVYFLGLVIVLTALIPAQKHKLAWAILPALCFSYGFARVHDASYTYKTISIIQPNIAQTMKWDPELMKSNFLSTVDLATQSSSDITIWPESSVPYQILREDSVREKIAQATKPGKYTIVSSARVYGDYETIWNSMFLLDSNGIVEDYYDKQHLVPFGEYVPLRSILPIDKITPGMVDFTPGEKGKILNVQGMRILPLICYEVIFPRYAMGNYDFMVNITNDAWFGNSTGPQQHLGMVRMRAIEQGRPVFRAANTGVSAFIDPYGRVVQKIDYGKKGILNVKIPRKINSNYSVYGDLLFIFLSLSILIAVLLPRKKSAKQ